MISSAYTSNYGSGLFRPVSDRKNFGKSDIVFATVRRPGEKDLDFRFEGVASEEEVVRAVKARLSFGFGMVSLLIRNYTQGWRRQRSFLCLSAG